MIIKLKKVGYFGDLSYGDKTQDTLVNARGKLEVDDAELLKIKKYLSSGFELIFSPVITKDILSKEEKSIGSAFIFSDGEWNWHSDLSYYVENYRVALPDEFLVHIRNAGYQVDLDAVAKRLENYEEY